MQVYALRLMHTGDSARVTSNGGLYHLDGGTFTLEAWIQVGEMPAPSTGLLVIITGGQEIFRFEMEVVEAGTTARRYVFHMKLFGIGDLKVSAKTDAVSHEPGWMHVAVVCSPGEGGAPKFGFYLDGLRLSMSTQQTHPGSGRVTSLNDIHMFTIGNPYPGEENQFVGLVMQARLWKVALDGATIRYQMHRAVPADVAGLLGDWTFTAREMIDRTSRARNGSLSGSASTVTVEPPVEREAVYPENDTKTAQLDRSPTLDHSPAPDRSPAPDAPLPSVPLRGGEDRRRSDNRPNPLDRPLVQLDPEGEPTVLAYNLPEPTSYRGRYIIELDFPEDYFTSPPSQSESAPQAGSGGQAGGARRASGGAQLNASPLGTVEHVISVNPGVEARESAPDLLGHQPPGGDSWLLGGARPQTRANDPHAADIEDAFQVAIDTGFFNPQIFPNVRGGDDEFSRRQIMELLTHLDKGTVVTQLMAGNRLAIFRKQTGEYSYRFIRKPSKPYPRIIIAESYRLTSFLGRYGAGRTLKTFTLLPGEKTQIRISTYKRSERIFRSASSVLDSTTNEIESEFERTVQQEQSNQNSVNSSFEYHAEGEAQAEANWGWGKARAQASGGVRGNSNASRDELTKNVTNAVAHNVARASSRRDVQVDTSLDIQLEEKEEEAIERSLQNINVSRTLNFVFRQMNQEFITFLHLVDVRVAFFNGYNESGYEVALPDLDHLLNRYIVPGKVNQVREAILGELQNITDYQGRKQDKFVEQVTRGKASYDRVNPEFKMTHRADERTSFELEGVIMAVDSHVIRTDGVLVEAFLGHGDGLDAYSYGLQIEEINRRKLENEQMLAEVETRRLANRIVEANDAERAALFGRLFPQLSHTKRATDLDFTVRQQDGRAGEDGGGRVSQ